MAAFAIEIYWPGMTEDSIRELVRRVKQTLASPTDEDAGVRYLGCMLSPDDEICFVRMEAEDAGSVAYFAQRLALGQSRISAMVDLSDD